MPFYYSSPPKIGYNKCIGKNFDYMGNPLKVLKRVTTTQELNFK